jgi:hypothetical protein
MDGTLDSGITVRRYAGATGRDLHIDVPLTNLTIGYEPQGLIAPLIYPIVPVEKETNVYYVWAKAETLRLFNSYRARGREANRINFDVSSDGYAVKNYALAIDLPYEDVANADAALNISESGARRVVNGLNLAWEDRLAVTLTSTTNMTSASALTNAWNDVSNSNPIEDLFIGRDAIRKATGYTPNVWIFSDIAWSRASRHPDVIEFIRGKGDSTGGGQVDQAQLAAALGGGQVLVGKGLKNTAGEGLPATYTDIWSTACVMIYVAPTPGLMEPSHGYTFRWTPPGMPGPLAVERYPNIRQKTESIEVHMFQDEKVTGTDLGFLIVGC